VCSCGHEARLRVLGAERANTTVFAWGDNEAGQLGVAGPGVVRDFVEVESLKGIGCVAVSSGNYLSAVLSGDGKAQLWGKGAIGQLGGEEEFSQVPLPLVSLDKRISAIAFGSFHVLAAAEDGALYSWGNGEGGQLGHGARVVQQYGPWRVTGLQHEYVVGIACGNQHSLAVTAGGDLYSWGTNDAGQLGHGHTEQVIHPCKVAALDKVRVDAVSAGFDHSTALSDGSALSWGSNSLGQLGLNHTDDVSLPQRIDLPPGEVAVVVACGVNHTAIVTHSGRLYTMGRGGRGRLGYGGTDDVTVPTLADVKGHVVDVCAGNAFTAMLTQVDNHRPDSEPGEDGYATLAKRGGKNTTTQLMVCGKVAESSTEELVPAPVHGPWGDNIVAMHAGLAHMLVVAITNSPTS